MTDNWVRYFSSSMAGAPSAHNAATNTYYIDVMDACLVYGFGEVIVHSLSVTNGVAVALVSGGHQFGGGTQKKPIIRINGTPNDALNGDFRVTILDDTRFSFEPRALVDGVFSGGITAKRASAMWGKMFASSDGKAAIYKSLDSESTGYFFSFPTLEGCVTAKDIQTKNEIFSSGVLMANAVWEIIADKKTVIFIAGNLRSGENARKVAYFGDFFSFIVGDCSQGICARELPINKGSAVRLPRNYSQYKILTPGSLSSLSAIGWSYSIAYGCDYSLFKGKGVYSLEILLHEEIGGGLQIPRGKLRGVYFTHFTSGTTIDENIACTNKSQQGREFIIRGHNYETSICVDITGPWS